MVKPEPFGLAGSNQTDDPALRVTEDPDDPVLEFHAGCVAHAHRVLDLYRGC